MASRCRPRPPLRKRLWCRPRGSTSTSASPILLESRLIVLPSAHFDNVTLIMDKHVRNSSLPRFRAEGDGGRHFFASCSHKLDWIKGGWIKITQTNRTLSVSLIRRCIELAQPRGENAMESTYPSWSFRIHEPDTRTKTRQRIILPIGGRAGIISWTWRKKKSGGFSLVRSPVGKWKTVLISDQGCQTGPWPNERFWRVGPAFIQTNNVGGGMSDIYVQVVKWLPRSIESVRSGNKVAKIDANMGTSRFLKNLSRCRMLCFFAFVVLFRTNLCSDEKDYRGHRLYRIFPSARNQSIEVRNFLDRSKSTKNLIYPFSMYF